MKIPKTVAIVDDEPDMLDYFSTILEDHHNVYTTTCPYQILAYIAKTPPDLLITDLMMPGKNGLEVIALVRREHDIPVIAVSGTSDKELREKAMAATDEFFSKPFDPKLLLSSVNRLIKPE